MKNETRVDKDRHRKTQFSFDVGMGIRRWQHDCGTSCKADGGVAHAAKATVDSRSTDCCLRLHVQEGKPANCHSYQCALVAQTAGRLAFLAALLCGLPLGGPLVGGPQGLVGAWAASSNSSSWGEEEPEMCQSPHNKVTQEGLLAGASMWPASQGNNSCFCSRRQQPVRRCTGASLQICMKYTTASLQAVQSCCCCPSQQHSGSRCPPDI